MTTRSYLAEPELEGLVSVQSIVSEDPPVVRLVATPFHVQGGGQKADRGLIGSVEVVDVRPGPDGLVDHYVSSLEGLAAGRTYVFSIDADWRRKNSSLHTAGHLLAAVCEGLFSGVRSVSGHQFPGEARVDFDVASADPAVVEGMLASAAMIEAEVRRQIAACLPVAIVGDPFVDRACRIGHFTPIACGGTHASSTGELGNFRVRSVKRKGGLVRVGYDLDLNV